MVVGEWPFFGCEILLFWLRNRLFWLRNRLFLVAESVIFGCEIGSFLVAEVPFFGCGSVSDFGCGIAEIWLRKRRNMVSESDFILVGYGDGLVRFQEAEKFSVFMKLVPRHLPKSSGTINNGFATLLEKHQRDSCHECISTETKDGLAKHHIRAVRAFPIRAASHKRQGE